ncbi:protein PGR-like [Phoenix dactylifera]|uniref:Protein PGR-like n=1 Tax=Phoenix dactylifera TaxID=42345 RepID=A0A8B9AKP8_PHODC|nr:protein PGR-like [Phoenix dactylifera]
MEGLLGAAVAGCVIGLAFVVIGLLTTECAGDVASIHLLVVGKRGPTAIKISVMNNAVSIFLTTLLTSIACLDRLTSFRKLG